MGNTPTAIASPPTTPMPSATMVSTGSIAMVPRTRGTTSFLIGSVPSARMALICSVTSIEPNSEPMPEPTRPAAIIAIVTREIRGQTPKSPKGVGGTHPLVSEVQEIRPVCPPNSEVSVAEFPYARCMLSFRTAGESHGQALIALVEGIPAHLLIDFEFIDHELKRRQGGYGRGCRMKIERDQRRFLSGVRH